MFFAAIALLGNFNSAFAFWDEFEQSILSSNSKYLYSNDTNKSHNKKDLSKEIIPILYKDNLLVERTTPKSKTILDVYLTPKTIEQYLSIKNIKPKDIEEPQDKKYWIESDDIQARDSKKLKHFVTQKLNKDGVPTFSNNWYRSFWSVTLNKGST